MCVLHVWGTFFIEWPLNVCVHCLARARARGKTELWGGRAHGARRQSAWLCVVLLLKKCVERSNELSGVKQVPGFQKYTRNETQWPKIRLEIAFNPRGLSLLSRERLWGCESSSSLCYIKWFWVSFVVTRDRRRGKTKICILSWHR